MTISVEWPPGESGLPPHRHPGGPCFGYVLDGEMLFELEGEDPRVIKAGEAFWEPGGEVIHYQDANNRTDIPLRFVVTMIMAPGQPMLVFVDDDELKQTGWVRRSAGSSTRPAAGSRRHPNGYPPRGQHRAAPGRSPNRRRGARSAPI